MKNMIAQTNKRLAAAAKKTGTDEITLATECVIEFFRRRGKTKRSMALAAELGIIRPGLDFRVYSRPKA